ncbi:uncharacterized protein LOC127105310 [Lathyrus oleraceus]|uniref:Uncharacterized protein n=2 Tax=Pisum sativum TaxID=3888 RepID=A0A9D4VK41_PEA|nr:uncharacterized protein LOC127105310 [Pisum sativum]XP_050898438.1 uncharacterized protein LOC127105310 [Pisum sativum]KAI5385001.1 hypothetical protein KIW84_071843 [Pisum sativum]
MPKVRREKSPAMNCSGSYPYPSENLELPKPGFGSAEDWKEWDDTRCSICMETPHNTVILKCSSYENGCRPYMCNTSYRHSNCLDQFCKSFDSHLTSAKLEEIPLIRTVPHDKKVRSEVVNPSQYENQLQPKLICPLCRGGVYGYMVSEPARRYMNCKQRTCSSETCEFQGTYPELRKHARLEHPSVRPSEVDFSRRCDWSRMEQQRDFEDLFSSINASSGAEYSGEEDAMHWAGGLADMMYMLVSEMYSPDTDGFVTSFFSDPTPRVPSHDRRSETIHVVPNDTQTNQSATPRSISSTLPDMSYSDSDRFMFRVLSYPMPSMPSHDIRSETMRWVSNDIQTNLSARTRSIFPSIHSEVDRFVTSFLSYPSPTMPSHDRRSERMQRMHGVSNNTRTNQSARQRSTLPLTHQGERIGRGELRSTLPSTHQRERIDRGGWRSVSSSSRDLEANRTARWRENIPSSRMAQAHSEIVENYYRELSPRRRPQVSQVSHTNPRHNYSSSRRIPGQQVSHTNPRHNYSSSSTNPRRNQG